MGTPTQKAPIVQVGSDSYTFMLSPTLDAVLTFPCRALMVFEEGVDLSVRTADATDHVLQLQPGRIHRISCIRVNTAGTSANPAKVKLLW